MNSSLYPASPIRQLGNGYFELAKPKPYDRETLYPLLSAGAGRTLRLRNPHENLTAALADIFKGELVVTDGEVHARWSINAARLMEVFEAVPEPQI